MIRDPLQQLARDCITILLLCASCYFVNAVSTTQFTHGVSTVYTKKLCLNGEEWTVLGSLLKRISRLMPQFGENSRHFPLLWNPPAHSAMKCCLANRCVVMRYPPQSPELALPDFFFYSVKSKPPSKVKYFRTLRTWRWI